MKPHQPEKLLGVGVGLRREYYVDFLEGNARGAAWLEVNTENYMPWKGGHNARPLQILSFLREQYPVMLHGLAMSLGSAEPTDYSYLKRVKSLADRLEPAMISDHLCWSGVDGRHLFDLLPLPFTEEAVRTVVRRIDAAQEFLGRRIMVENVSSYLEFEHAEMAEWDFINEVVRRADCYLLLDVNNVHVTSHNHGYDPHHFLRQMPHDRVFQIHLAGYATRGELLIDTHGGFVSDEVWKLYSWYISTYGAVSTNIEWDSNLPPWSVMKQELTKIERILESGFDRSQESRCA